MDKDNMGTFHYFLDVGDPSGRYFTRVLALVDTGATYTFLPEDLLDDMGVEKGPRRRFRQADGSVKIYPIGQTWLRIDREAFVLTVAFCPKDINPTIGAETLEVFGLGVDPNGRRLIRVDALR